MGGSAPKVVREFNQAHYPALTQDKELKAGVCAAMSLQWIARAARGDDFWDYIVSPDGQANTIALQRREKQSGKLFDAWREQNPLEQWKEKNKDTGQDVLKRGKYKLADAKAAHDVIVSGSAEMRRMQSKFRADYLKAHGMERPDEPKIYTTAGDVCDDLMRFNGFAYIAAWSSENEKGHAICAFISNGGVRVMDPNHGELSTESPEIAQFGLTEHLDSQKNFLGKIEKFTVDFYPWAIAPQQPSPSQSAPVVAGGTTAEESGSASG
ncbi:MAG TPA: YopT-type cysteine protease domain-containing protein [Vineibacter sp.]|nr:YopT-type cysteine protease domain-containing protein [Vineibacter sp.]